MNEGIDIRKIKSLKAPQTSSKKLTEDKKGIWDFLNRDIRFGASRIPDKIKEGFYLELWSLLQAGVDIRTALELISADHKKKKIKEVFNNVTGLIVAGATLSAALKKTNEFSSYEYYSVQIGEESGKLLQVLKELADYFNKKIKQRRQIIGAIIYPVVVLVVAFGAVSFMVSYVVPMFSDTFKRFGNDLPAITKGVINVSSFIKKFSGVFFVIVLAVIAFGIWQRKTGWFRNISSKILLGIPIVGSIVKKIYLSRFSNTMALLLGSKIPMLQSIQLTRQMVSFYPIEKSLSEIEKQIVEGNALYKSLSKYSIYPSKMVSIVKVGEEVNQLELFFGRLAEQYSNEVEYQTTMLSKFLEPLIIIVLGIVVGVILIAMYLPLFKLGQAF
jgi:type IV pilus assembly protein PilC